MRAARPATGEPLLDRFKETNNTLGHDAGDFVLIEVVKRLRACTRSMDLVARLGGDEFAVIVDGLEGRPEITALARRIVDALGNPFVYRGQCPFSACSIGIARCPDEADTAEDLQRCADLALYDAESAGRGRWAFFRPELLDSLKSRHALERDLREAIATEAMKIWYQPKLSGCGARGPASRRCGAGPIRCWVSWRPTTSSPSPRQAG